MKKEHTEKFNALSEIVIQIQSQAEKTDNAEAETWIRSAGEWLDKARGCFELAIVALKNDTN